MPSHWIFAGIFQREFKQNAQKIRRNLTYHPTFCYTRSMNITSFLMDVVGWLGAALVLVAYALLSIDWITGNSPGYQALNIAGALLLVINSYYVGAYPSVGVNAAWVGIAMLTIFRDWWKGPVAAYQKVKASFPKRQNLRKFSLRHIKLPNFKKINQTSRLVRATINNPTRSMAH